MRTRSRGIALITVLLAVGLVMALLAVMVDIGTSRLRQTNEQARGAQALAAADAGASWVRALLEHRGGILNDVVADLTLAHSTTTISIDSGTTAQVLVGLNLPGTTKQVDHLDVNLQENPQILEAPLQVVSTATVTADGHVVATRTVTTLLRIFRNFPPNSEIVGVIDEGGPSSSFSPGDPAGQPGGAYTTDLRISAFTQTGTASPAPANVFKNDSWSDGNLGSPGILP